MRRVHGGQNLGDSGKRFFKDLFGKCMKVRESRPALIVDTVSSFISPEIGSIQIPWICEDRVIGWHWPHGGKRKEDLKQSASSLAFAFINSITSYLMRGGVWCVLAKPACVKLGCKATKPLSRRLPENCDAIEWFKLVLGIDPRELS